jgi:signal transduction histidine kinase
MSEPAIQNSSKRSTSRRDAWERWVVIWHIVFYVSLVLPTGMAWFSNNLNQPRELIFGLSVALGVWYGVIMIWLVARSREKLKLIWSLVYLIVAIALWYPLARANWAYFITASSFYGLMWGALPFGFAVAGNVVLTALIVWVQALNLGRPVVLSANLFLIGGVVIAWSALLALWMRTVMRESAQRKLWIKRLEAAQEDLAAAEREAGILQERQRLAQEIHDTLAQSFTSIVMQLEAADQALPGGSDNVHKHIRQARDTARASLAEARRLVLALQPTPLEGASLPDALGRVVKRWSQETGIEAEYTTTGDPSTLHPEIEVTLLRALQEALNNVRKHAQAQLVNVTLSYMEDQVALDIKDDGIGFNPQEVALTPNQVGGGFGLRAMRERAAQFGGVVIVESSPEQGTTVAVQIPLSQADSEEIQSHVASSDEST